MAASWCKQWCKRGVVRRARRRHCFRRPLACERQVGQSIQGASNVEESGVGVDVRGQLWIAVPHRRLRRSKGHAALRKMGSKAVTKADDIQRLSTLIELGNPGSL